MNIRYFFLVPFSMQLFAGYQLSNISYQDSFKLISVLRTDLKFGGDLDKEMANKLLDLVQQYTSLSLKKDLLTE